MKIHEFDPVIYPRKLWVAVSTDTFSDRFEGVSEWDDMLMPLYKQRNLGGILVRYESKNAITIANIAHESSHIAMNIFDYIGAKVDLANQETFSYLVGWIADCINQVRTGKFKD